jgi:hypothetical protein
MTVPTTSIVSSLDCISRPPIDIRILTTTRTLTMASCHFLTRSRAAARLSCASAETHANKAKRMPALTR